VARCEFHLNTAGGMGGAIAVDMDAAPVIRDCHIHDNTASSGGGICSGSGGGVIEECTIEGNTATFGGGVALMSALDVVMTDTRIAWNEAVHSGGGLYASDSPFEVTDCEIEDNSTQGSGGAVWLLNARATFTRTTFLRNSALVSTGGILIDASELTVSLSEIEGNGVGLRVLSPGRSLADARHNWWGHDTGPFHPTLNPGGLGDSVSDGVQFVPWSVTTGIDDEPVMRTSWGAIKAAWWTLSLDR
jgi:hypothetical protein